MTVPARRPRLGGDLGAHLTKGTAVASGLPGGPDDGLNDRQEDFESGSLTVATSTTAASSLLARGLVYVLVAAIVCGPLALLYVVTHQPEPPPAAVASDSPDRDARRAAAQEVAVQWTRAFLSTPAAQADQLAAYWSGPLTLPSTAAAVSDATALDSAATAPGVWTVTVALDVTPAGGVRQRRYFQTPIAVAGGIHQAQATPMTVPAEISGPGPAAQPALAYPVAVSSTGAAGVTVHGFLTAFLAGTGDLTRWSAPGLAAVPVTPPPCADVLVAQLQASEDAAGLSTGLPADGTTVHLLATVTTRLPPAIDGQADAFRTGQYLLAVTARAGRWEVSAIDNTPVVSAGSSAAAAPSAPSPVDATAPTPAPTTQPPALTSPPATTPAGSTSPATTH